MALALLEQERWICQNGACGCEIAVIKPSDLTAGGLPRCRCGSIMKKFYTSPKFRHLTSPEAERLFLDSTEPTLSPVRETKSTKRER
jgi:hypothetical protein